MLEPQNEATVPNRKYLIISLLAILLIYVLWHFYNNQSDEEEIPAAEAVVVEETNADEMPLVVEDFAVATESSDAAAPVAAEDTAPAAADETVVAPVSQVVITEAAFEEPKPAKVEPAKTEDGVVVKVKDETWVEVKDGSKLYLSKVLQPGTTYVLPEGGKGMILSVGKVKGVEVYINGKLTPVATNAKKTNIAIDPFIEAAAH